MKKILLICFLLTGMFVSAQKKVEITVEWHFDGVIENYDHDNKMEVYIDDKYVMTSSINKESEKNQVKISVKRGNHKLKVVNYAEYNGVWECHIIKNDFSLDAIYEVEKSFEKNEKIELIFDITAGSVIVK